MYFWRDDNVRDGNLCAISVKPQLLNRLDRHGKICLKKRCRETTICFILQVEEVRRHSHCLAFSSAGPQSQTYYISYDSYTEHLRWHRTASKVLMFLFVSTLTLLASIITFLSSHKFKVDISWWQAGFYTLFTASCGLKMLITLSCPRLSLSDCVPEGELSRPVVLQPGGAACSALLQPGPHAPQSQKQLHVAAQRCFSTDQVSFCPQHRVHHHPVCSGTRQHRYYSLYGTWNVPQCFLLSWGATIWSKEEAA